MKQHYRAGHFHQRTHLGSQLMFTYYGLMLYQLKDIFNISKPSQISDLAPLIKPATWPVSKWDRGVNMVKTCLSFRLITQWMNIFVWKNWQFDDLFVYGNFSNSNVLHIETHEVYGSKTVPKCSWLTIVENNIDPVIVVILLKLH